MGCRVGMSTDVEQRVKTLKEKNKVPNYATHEIVQKGLSYNGATELEKYLQEKYKCKGEAGGPKVPGPAWSVYMIYW